MPNYRLLLEYDGRAFEGWQVQQEGSRTVQGCLQAAIAQVAGEWVGVTGSGRTDSGVHADAQVANFELVRELDPGRLLRSLNGVLPRDVAVRAVDIVPSDFDAQRSAVGKHYLYRIWNAPERSPLREARFHHVPQPLDLAAMCAAAEPLLGEHDFSSFRAAGSDAKTSVRRLFRLDLSGKPGGEIRIEAEGSGFLRYMVRNIVGSLLEVGRGRIEAEQMGEILAGRERALAGPTAPAHGLTLLRVDYPETASGPDIPQEKHRLK